MCLGLTTMPYSQCVTSVVFLSLSLLSVASEQDGTVVIDRIVAFPEVGEYDSVLLKNPGDEPVNLEGWWMSDIRKNKTNPDGAYFFGSKSKCTSFTRLPAGGSLLLTPFTASNPCGLPFGISTKDQLHLFNEKDESMAYVAWNWSLPGLSLRLTKDSTYQYRSENKPAAEIMEDQEDLTDFIKALQVTDEWKTVYTTSVVTRSEFGFSPNDLIPFQSAGVKRNESLLENFMESLPTNETIFPYPGRLTVLCPTNKAMQEFYEDDFLGEGLSPEEVRDRTEFSEIVKFHILPGEWMSGYFMDGLTLKTSLKDGELSISRAGGRTYFTGICSQEYSTETRPCACEGRCPRLVESDLFASNGVVHIIDQVLIPPRFVKEEEEIDMELIDFIDEEMDAPDMEL